ncbi:MAG TPA: PAS domain S-box protein, partial [Gaiellaceae bacterium]|nr:PAS domain S-box protein [Gaiellaceae bacterium]
MTTPLERQLEVASLSGEVESVMAGIVTRLMQFDRADGASLSTIDDEFAYFKVCEGADFALQGQTMPLASTLGNECIVRRDVTVLRATTGREVTRCLTPGAGAIVLAPIEYDGAIRGVLGVRSADPAAFDVDEVETLRLLARAASIALRNAELVDRLAHSEREYRELHAQAADAILVSDTDGNLIDANAAAAALLWYSVEELRGLRMEELFAPVSIDPTPSRLRELLERRELRGERTYRRSDETLLELEFSSKVIDDGRIHTTLRDVSQRKRDDDRLRSSLERMRAVIQTQQEISALEPDPEAITATIVERAQRLTGADGAAVQWFEGTESVLRHASGICATHAGLRVSGELSLAGAAARAGEPVYAPDAHNDPRVDGDAARRIGARSLICAPLYRDGQVVGVLSILGTEAGAFDELAVETTRLMAEFVSSAMRNSAELEKRHELVEGLRESESRFRGAFHASSLGMALTTLDGTFVQVNDKLAEMLGYTVDELSSLGVRGISHPDDLGVDLARAEQLRTGEIDSYRREKRYLRKNGSVLWAELTVSLVVGNDGEPTHVVSHVQDMTAQKEASLLFEATFARSVVPKLIADDERRIVELNQSAADLLGVSHDDALRLTVDDLLPEEPIADLWASFLEVGALEAEVTLHRPDRAQRRIELTATANVRPGRHIAVVRDLTRQKDLEGQLRQAQKMEAVGRLAGGIAHDFNNLLTAIAGYSEFLIDGQTDARLRRHAEEIKKAAARAAALTGQLLAFSRRQVLQPRVLDLNAVVSDMDMMLRRLIGEDVELVTMLEPELGAIRADPTQLEQVIVNLAVNARDAMPGGGSVTIETANIFVDDDAAVELRLTDTGVGMSDAERSQLFDPFFTTKAGGTGLGLATVHGIVEQSGGTIEVTSSPGMGSSFRILFPSVAALTDRPESPAAVAKPRRGDETVLLVEDEAVVRLLVAEILEASGYTVLQAADGPSALELVRRHAGEISLLVTDVVMPGMSGPEVAQSVTAMRPGTVVLYMSGYTDSAIGHHGVLEPGIAFLQKPFSTDDLTRKVRALL